MLWWAIALDDGRLVFAAEGGLELAQKCFSPTRIAGYTRSTRWESTRKDALHDLSVCGVESIDDVGFDPTSRGNLEAVLAGPIADRFQLLR